MPRMTENSIKNKQRMVEIMLVLRREKNTLKDIAQIMNRDIYYVSRHVAGVIHRKKLDKQKRK